MLGFLRKAVKSWVAKGLLALLIASFAVWGISDIFTGRFDAAVARVGAAEVPATAFASAVQRQRNALSQAQGRAVSYAEIRLAGFDRLILAGLMRDRAFAEELAALGISAPDAAVAENIRTNEAFRGPAGGFSSANYRLTLGRIGYTPTEFEELTRTLLAQQLLDDAASGSALPPPGLAARIAAHQGERRRVATVTLPLSAAPDPGEPGEAALEDWRAANAARYRLPERRDGVYLHVDPAAMAAEFAPDPEAVAAWYEANRDLYTVEPAREIDQLPLGSGDPEALAARVRSGEIGFDALARELGEDPADLSLGRVTPADLPEASAEAVFGATGPGVVGPVTLPSGAAVLIRIRSVEAGGTRALEAVAGEIAVRLAEERALAEAPDIANRIDDLRAAGRPLEAVAAELGLTLHRFDGLAADGSLADGGRADGLAADPAFRAEVFVALDHEERDIIETAAGGYFLALVERIEPARDPALAEIRDTVAADWAADARGQALLAAAERTAAAVSGGLTLAALAAQSGLRLTEHTAFPREAAPEAIPFDLAARLFRLPEGGAAAAALPDAGGVMIAEVAGIEPAAPELVAFLAARIEATLARQYTEDTREFFARAIEAGFPSTIDAAAVEAVFEQLGAARGG